ncbi:hypothetical protein [Streptomyces sp. NPDC057582]|uniref:hypothetical protein n=1 Tax=Streptomyces sp. NPDC057582 TaxID=3346174 RepID=UPI0036B891B1
MAPLFMGLQANTPGRESDLDFYAESVRDLWHADRPLADAAERVRLLEQFPELQPNEEGITDVAHLRLLRCPHLAVCPAMKFHPGLGQRVFMLRE